jgi:predicted nucleic acid-binding protein
MNADKVRILFFDTSALVKRYHQEKGTDVVDVAFDQEGIRIISDISVIEFFSAFAKKVKTGEITKEDFQVTIKELADDILSGIIQVEQLGENEKKTAATLIEKYGLSENLRTLDSMQIAVIEKLGSDHIDCVYCADLPMISILKQEGFKIVNPEEEALSQSS